MRVKKSPYMEGLGILWIRWGLQPPTEYTVTDCPMGSPFQTVHVFLWMHRRAGCIGPLAFVEGRSGSGPGQAEQVREPGSAAQARGDRAGAGRERVGRRRRADRAGQPQGGAPHAKRSADDRRDQRQKAVRPER